MKWKRSKALIFSEYGINFTKTSNDRESGWLALKELLCAEKVKIFSQCREIIRCLPALTVDKIRPTDCSTEPHEITHAPDALRGFCVFYARPADEGQTTKQRVWSADMWEDYYSADEAGQKYLKRKYGEPI